MKIIGIDLSGPSNHKDTVMAILKENKQLLNLEYLQEGASDEEIFNIIRKEIEKSPVYIGIDAPLSYQDGGGDRPHDRSLRAYAKSLGMKSGSIMPPTLTRMVYLTMRGIHLAHMLRTNFGKQVSIVEVHPGVTLASRLPEEKRTIAFNYKKEKSSRVQVIEWLTSQMLSDSATAIHESSTHTIDAVLAGVAAWHTASKQKTPTWYKEAEPPHHPFPFSC
ncbi:DUF429 domain-containing protein [Halobacillus mangrovi]|uniref:DUF429 domain-containing protein n=1 Tax=Halobacillus mangrovi TaxID=402384 RepID=A0A1W5ZRI3_9BACI|nr:DUF429 domain-containing protein [Halobacillus mangrovi]ARI75904.1 hypothetical protein HM131_03260 [Halobacillus mangrovi]